MNNSVMRFLLFNVSIVLLIGCASDYQYLQHITTDTFCANKIKSTHLSTAWYSTAVDVYDNHISGLLVIKNMPDSTIRVVFTNEAGITFFDFEFSDRGDFIVHFVVHQLDKKYVLQTLRKDFELILGIPFHNGKIESWAGNDQLIFGVKKKKETAYFITSKDCASLRNMEYGSDRKRKVSVLIVGSYPSPEAFEITHHTFDMKLKLKHLPRE